MNRAAPLLCRGPVLAWQDTQFVGDSFISCTFLKGHNNKHTSVNPRVCHLLCTFPLLCLSVLASVGHAGLSAWKAECLAFFRLFVLLTLWCLCPMGGACASFLKGAEGWGGGFVCFSTVPGEVTAIPALFTETHSSVWEWRPVNSHERAKGAALHRKGECRWTSMQNTRWKQSQEREGSRAWKKEGIHFRKRITIHRNWSELNISFVIGPCVSSSRLRANSPSWF